MSISPLQFQMGSTMSLGKRFADSDSVSDLDRLSTVDEEHNRLRVHLPKERSSVSSAAKKTALRRTHLNMTKYDE